MNYVIPAILVLLVIFAAIKRVNVYDAFVEGGKESMSLVKDVFPYLAAIFILIELFKTSGLTVYLTKIFEKPFAFFGIPKEVTEVMILRPFSGAGSVALLENIFKDYGADSYVGKCAAVIIGSEGQGICRELFDAAQGKIIIPMSPRCESLNAAVAAAIVLWQMKR